MVETETVVSIVLAILLAVFGTYELYNYIEKNVQLTDSICGDKGISFDYIYQTDLHSNRTGYCDCKDYRKVFDEQLGQHIEYYHEKVWCGDK